MGAKSFLQKAFWSVPIAVTFNDYLYSMTYIHDSGMEPLLKGSEADRDLVLVKMIPPRAYDYYRGGVYLMRSKNQPGKTAIRRVIALEGDWIASPTDLGLQQVPKGCCWVEEDNDTESQDTSSGLVPIALLQGRVSHIIWPPARFQQISISLPDNRVIVANPKPYKDIR